MWQITHPFASLGSYFCVNDLQCAKNCKAAKHAPGPEVGPTAAWRLLPLTIVEYIADRGPNLTALAGIPGWSLDAHKGDVMHVVYLGFGLHVLGSCIMALSCINRWPGNNFKGRMKNAWFLWSTIHPEWLIQKLLIARLVVVLVHVLVGAKQQTVVSHCRFLESCLHYQQRCLICSV